MGDPVPERRRRARSIALGAGRRRHPAGVRRHRRRCCSSSTAAAARSIDTTCGSVLNVWKNVRRYAEGGYTSIIHGKVWHEETQATASQAVQYGGQYLVVFDRAETDRSCDYIRRGGDRDGVPRSSSPTPSRPASTPTATSQRIGLANQTTMLMSESLEIGEMIRHGDARPLRRRRRSPRTIRRSTRSAAPRRIGRTPSSRCCATEPVDLDDRHRRLQQQQHREPRAHLRRVAADVPHRGSRTACVSAGRSGIARSGRKPR